MKLNLKMFLPRGLYGRAALILIVPIVTIQLVVSVGFMQRHFDDVTEQMTGTIADEVVFMLEAIARAPKAQKATVAQSMAQAFNINISFAAQAESGGDHIWFWDLPGKTVISTLRRIIPQVYKIDLITHSRKVRLFIDSPLGPLYVEMSRQRVSVRNPHQLPLLMLFITLLMTVIAYYFLRNQLRPIAKLAQAAESYGMGKHLRYHPQGALEVRAAGQAFLQMRDRIEHQIEQRTMMLSGVGHDLRTPLTRLRLGLSLLPEEGDTLALIVDVTDMERLIDEFLAFSRGETLDEAALVDLVPLVARVVQNLRRIGHDVQFDSQIEACVLRCSAAAIGRAVENLAGNAVRYGTNIKLSLRRTAEFAEILVEDNGPGIAPEDYEKALLPFSRLEKARDPNKGGGVGLGLSIANDIARTHNGVLILGNSHLGGLQTLLRLPYITF